jgi:PhnB protein
MAQPVTPYLSIKGAARALEFYARSFGAKETMRLTEPGGSRVGHAEMDINGGVVMLADEFPEHGVVGPQTIGGTPVTLALQVPDVDDVVTRAVAAGARLITPVADQFYGERSGKLEDPFGHRWHVSTTIEKVAPDEMQRRWNAMAKG